MIDYEKLFFSTRSSHAFLFYPQIETVKAQFYYGVDFGAGISARGMAFNNYNLHNFWYLLAHYSDDVGKYGTVGTLLERIDNSVNVYFYFSNLCLGQAFKLTDKHLQKFWYPSISASANQTVKYSFPQFAPTSRIKEYPIESQDPYAGKWVLETMKEHNTINQKSFQTTVTVSLDREDPSDSYLSLGFHVFNSFSGSISLQEELDDEKDMDKVSVGSLFTTYMGLSPEAEAFESQVVRFLTSITGIKRLADSEDEGLKVLLMEGPDFELYLKEVQEKFDPLTHY